MPLQIYEDHESSVRSYCRNFPVEFVNAKGAILRASNGREYLDLLAGCGSLNYGHNESRLKSALIQHIADDGIALGLDLHTEAKSKFIATFQSHILAPRALNYKLMFPGPTGTNAVEAALKIARKATGRSNVISFSNGFHGMTIGALSLTGNLEKRAGAGIDLPKTTVFPFCTSDVDASDALDRIETVLANPSSGVEPPAAFVVECIQGEGGLSVASDAWLFGLQELGKRYGILLIIDEVQTGCGRSGDFFAFERSGIKPDIVVMAKSISGFGLPMSLTLISPELDVWKPGEHNGTFRGNKHAFVTAAHALHCYWRTDELKRHVAELSSLITKRLTILAASVDSASLVGRGLMQGLKVSDGAAASKVCDAAFERGLIIETSGAHGEVIKLLPPLTISIDDLNLALDRLSDALEASYPTLSSAAA